MQPFPCYPYASSSKVLLLYWGKYAKSKRKERKRSTERFILIFKNMVTLVSSNRHDINKRLILEGAVYGFTDSTREMSVSTKT